MDTDCRSLRSLEGASPFNPWSGRGKVLDAVGQARFAVTDITVGGRSLPTVGAP